MGRSTLVRLAHSDHPIASPVSDARVDDLLRRAVGGRASVLDLGCGDGTWLLRALRQHPSLTAVGVDTSDVGFEQTFALVTQHGWATVHGHVSTQEEWDDYEWAWTGAPARWAVENPADPEAREVLAEVEKHRDGWLHGYRGRLGFVTLLLHPGRAAVTGV